MSECGLIKFKYRWLIRMMVPTRSISAYIVHCFTVLGCLKPAKYTPCFLFFLLGFKPRLIKLFFFFLWLIMS